MVPVRTCVSCRQKALRADLLRVVAQDEQLIVDDRALLHGRGAWVHASVSCLNQAVTRGAFERSLKTSGRLDVGSIENRLKTLMDN